MRRHQRYDAEQIVRDTGERQERNRCSVRYSISRYLLPTGYSWCSDANPYPGNRSGNDLELALFPDEHGDLSIEIPPINSVTMSQR